MGVAAKYTDEFERFWRAYEPRKTAPNASKHDAFKAWNQVSGERPSLEPLLAAVVAYRASLKCKGERDAYAKHPASWLRARGWEPFIEVLTAMAAEAAKQDWQTIRHWNGQATKLVEKIGASAFITWFSDTMLVLPQDHDGPRAVLLVPTKFKRDWIQGHYQMQLDKVFGECAVEVSKSQE